MLARHEPAQVDQAQQRLAIPGFQLKAFRVVGLEQGQFACWVVDQGGKLGTDGLGYVFTQDKINFFADNTGSGVQQVDKSLVFAVQVTDIMLGALGQLGGGFQADNALELRPGWDNPVSAVKYFNSATLVVGIVVELEPMEHIFSFSKGLNQSTQLYYCCKNWYFYCTLSHAVRQSEKCRKPCAASVIFDYLIILALQNGRACRGSMTL